MPRSKTAYGWIKNGKIYASARPRKDEAASNVYASPREALRDATGRGLKIEWEDRDAIDRMMNG